MLYQFVDIPANSSIQQIIRKRTRVVESLVIFMSDYSHDMCRNAINLGYQVGKFTFINLLGTNHIVGKEKFTLEDLIGNDNKFQLLKKEESTIFYMYDSHIVVKVRIDNSNIMSVTYSYPDYVKTDYYSGKLLYTKKKDNNSDSTVTTYYDNNGDVFYISSKEDCYTYKGQEYCSKIDFYNKLLSDYSFTNKDVISIDWCHGFESVICKNKKDAKVVAPLYSEIFNSSSIYSRNGFYEHNNIPVEFEYMARKLANPSNEPYCDVRYGFRFAADIENGVDAIYPQTKKMKEIIENHMEVGLFPKKEVEIYKMLDYEITPNRSNGNKKICAVSRISLEKRIDWIIKAVFFAHKIDPDITLDIYGEGAKEQEMVLKQLVKDLRAEDYITFKGWLKDKTTMADYALFMNTSLTEGYPLSVLEAISCGCPIVASDIVGHSELVKENSILVDFEGKTENKYCIDLSHAIIDALSRFEELNRGAVKFAKEHLTKEVTDANIKKLFSI